MKIILTGATGFIGGHVIRKLNAAGHEIEVLGRRPVKPLPFHEWDSSREPRAETLACDAVIHLAGETVAQRWTPQAKQRMRDSRVEGTRHLAAALAKAAANGGPRVLVSASAVGIYGSRGDEVLTEVSERGSGFLADLTADWEAAARAAEPFGIRVVHLRFGLVLGRDGGAFPKMLTPFRLGLGGRLGSGTQWVPWVHIEDVASLAVFALLSDTLQGPVNVTAPHPVTNADFTKTLGHVLHRPSFMAVPEFALRAALGEMSEALLASERAIPAAAQTAGFPFRYADLESALRDLR